MIPTLRIAAFHRPLYFTRLLMKRRPGKKCWTNELRTVIYTRLVSIFVDSRERRTNFIEKEMWKKLYNKKNSNDLAKDNRNVDSSKSEVLEMFVADNARSLRFRSPSVQAERAIRSKESSAGSFLSGAKRWCDTWKRRGGTFHGDRDRVASY